MLLQIRRCIRPKRDGQVAGHQQEAAIPRDIRHAGARRRGEERDAEPLQQERARHARDSEGEGVTRPVQGRGRGGRQARAGCAGGCRDLHGPEHRFHHGPHTVHEDRDARAGEELPAHRCFRQGRVPGVQRDAGAAQVQPPEEPLAVPDLQPAHPRAEPRRGGGLCEDTRRRQAQARPGARRRAAGRYIVAARLSRGGGVNRPGSGRQCSAIQHDWVRLHAPAKWHPGGDAIGSTRRV
mmetsp:Transcript_101251/g.287084  ORF Transcript_101251/g.287084 Transcript_101251/m.287084 type:complete len:238 (-) Transcript_101251:39-752(-)